MKLRPVLTATALTAGLLVSAAAPASAGSGSFYNYKSSVCANSKQAYMSQTASFSWDTSRTNVSEWRTTLLSRYCGSSSLATANRLAQLTQFRFGGSAPDCSFGVPANVQCSNQSTQVVWTYNTIVRDNAAEQYRTGSSFSVRGDANSITMASDYDVTQGSYTHSGTVQSGPRSI